jgi:hypothetical protein
MRIFAGSSVAGKLSITTPDYVRINGDLNVTGEMLANKITSKTRVDAGTGMSAGSLGFVTVTGGISVGIPIAAPLQINCAGAINSLVSMSAPLGTFGVLSAIIAGDTVNETIRNFHFHVAPYGLTSTPTTQEVKVR